MVKDLLRKFAEGTPDTNLFTPEAKALLFPERAKSFGEYLKPLGTLDEVQLIERTTEEGNRNYRYRLVYKDAALLFTLKLDSESKTALIAVEPE